MGIPPDCVILFYDLAVNLHDYTGSYKSQP